MPDVVKGLILILCFHCLGCGQQKADFYDPSVKPGCAAKVIDGEYLIKFRDRSSVRKLKLNRHQLARILEDRSVQWVEPNYRVQPDSPLPFLTEGLPNPNAIIIGATYAWNRGIRGQEVIVAVVDSGVDDRHPLLNGKVVAGYNFIEDSPQVRDETGHGTHIAGIIAGSRSENFSGIAPRAQLIAADFMNEDRGDEFNAVRAVDFAIRNGAKIINNSWSNLCSHAIRQAFTGWENLDVVFVNAAGNDAERIDDLSIFPANLLLRNGVTVGSVSPLGIRSAFSNYGRNVVVYAPGEDIFSLSTMDYGVGYFVPRSGTSMATAFVSGALALTWSAAPRATAQRIVQELRMGTTAQNADQSPIVNVERLIKALR